jgi:hypothetical protein
VSAHIVDKNGGISIAYVKNLRILVRSRDCVRTRGSKNGGNSEARTCEKMAGN